MVASGVTWAGLIGIGRLCAQINSRLLGASSKVSCLHTSTQLNCKQWERKNRVVYPPQQKDEPRRPAEIYHSRRQIKYSKDKMWYLAKLIKGMTIDQALTQLEFNDKKGAKIIKEVLLEAQEMAVKNHNVEYRSNLYIAESYSGKGKYLKRIRYHGRGMFGIMDKVHCHLLVKLAEEFHRKWNRRRDSTRPKSMLNS